MRYHRYLWSSKKREMYNMGGYKNMKKGIITLLTLGLFIAILGIVLSNKKHKTTVCNPKPPKFDTIIGDDVSVNISNKDNMEIVALESIGILFKKNEPNPVNSDKMKEFIDTFLENCRKDVNATILIEGYASPKEKNSLILSEQRAEKIKDYILSREVISKDKITVKGNGVPDIDFKQVVNGRADESAMRVNISIEKSCKFL